MTLHISKVAPLISLILIPLSWIVQIMYNNHIMAIIVSTDLSSEKLSIIEHTYVHIPMAAVLTFATIVIPAIMARKAIREGTINMGYDKKVRNESQL